MTGRADIWYVCPACGKRAYESRKAARRNAYDGMSPYPCRRLEAKYGNTVWHYGHLREDVRRGDVTRGEFYGADGVGIIRHKYGRGWTDRNAS